MTHEELNKYIDHYLNEDKTHSAIMLTAPWGTGKSYYIQNDLVPFLSKEENGKIKCIVVSLYGLKNLDDLSKALYLECRLKILSEPSEAVATGKFISKTIVKGVTSFFGVDLSKTDEEMKESGFMSYKSGRPYCILKNRVIFPLPISGFQPLLLFFKITVCLYEFMIFLHWLHSQ